MVGKRRQIVDEEIQEEDLDAPIQEAAPHKYFADQFDDETVLYVFRKHPIVMRKGIILWALGMLSGPIYVLALTFIYKNDPSKFPSPAMFFVYLAIGFALSLVLFAPSYISWFFSVFIVTDQRFITITQKGLFHRSVADVGLEHIQSVNYEVAGLQATLLGFGTMKIQTYIGDVSIHELHHPAKIQKRIIGILREQEVDSIQHAIQVSERDKLLKHEEAQP
jgi:uncharacterized membrane protein YdbT with pleckstrin-like domain